MWTDTLVEEVRQRRRTLMAELDYTPQRVLQALREEREKYWERLTSGVGSQESKQATGTERASVTVQEYQGLRS